LKARNKARLIEDFSYKVKLCCNGREIEEEGYLDSGNMLCDPVTKRPVVLISFDVFAKLYSNINYLSAFMKNIDTKILCEGHYIKINSVGSGTSILVFTADFLEVSREEQSRRYEKVSLGLSFSGFERAFGKGILLNSEFI
ncbi:MAG: sigma-E processing peptidase SpoIIGA, partial [Acetobacter sp.]|nr:sigma-E processing peptidase SpoIIGA [Acetobacter sp.]